MMNNVKVETSDTYIDRKIQKEREKERERMIRLEDKERQGVGYLFITVGFMTLIFQRRRISMTIFQSFVDYYNK